MDSVSQAPVSLDAVLAAREQRVVRQRAALTEFGKPVLSLTLVCPGPVKDTPRMRFVFDQALMAIDDLLATQKWTAPFRNCITPATGPEAILAIDCQAQALKQALSTLENEHPLGRLWDMDVIDLGAGTISRARLGLAPRQCLVCGEAAHACARSRAHPLEELVKVIEERVDGYRRSLVQ